MEVYHLYSGGKDSSLAAYILERLGYEVKLVTVNFGVLDSWKYARETAQSLGFEHEVFFLDRKILEKATEMCINDKHPNNAIQFIHERALEEIARREDVERVSDGTRRDDRVPLLDQRKTRSLEDRFNVQYIRPLLGLGYKTIRELTDRLFIIELKESEKLEKSDYEVEIRYLLREKGIDPLTIFPKRHLQSRVLGWKKEKAHL
ncbi:7-cyano-7-deazaguanine synthase [Thermococcus argininiproducens]|uniref:7-cyano-7-deazaguanine synthase n=1 Tax=Thermococcus argininiproducens TaxID=2866384 RepID=A0A9E7SBN5_9EURY|nr:asparagine synthase-related protein [Thermococcus argininiproducens]USG99064.1 7-cyano-7-deazaguanine synthase [Thermococcus argininiproducens]